MSRGKGKKYTYIDNGVVSQMIIKTRGSIKMIKIKSGGMYNEKSVKNTKKKLL